jgi:hypothetical protein
MTTRYMILIFVGMSLGEDGEASGPTFADTSFRFMRVDHPLRKICIRILLNP